MKTTNNNYTEDEFLEKIRYLFNTEQGDKAVDYILEAAKLYPRNGEFLFLKGNILHNSGDYEEAIKCFEKAEKCGFNPVSALRCKAHCYLCDDEYEKAIDCYDQAIKEDPNDAETWYSKGRTLGIMNKFEEAYNCFNRAVELAPKNSNYQEFKRLASEELRKINIPEGLESSLTNERECFKQGNDFMDEGLYKNAHLCFKQAVEFNPDNDEAWGCLGIALIKLGDYDKALKTFEKTISLKEKSVWWFYKGLALDKLKKAEKAIKCLYKAVAIDPGNEDYWFFLGGLLAEERKYEDAIICYKNVTSLNPDFAEAWREIGDITLHGLRKYEEAISYYDKVIELNPKDDNTTLMKGLALSYTANKKEEEAIKWYDKALKINPDNQQAMENKGVSLRKLGRMKEARACNKNAAKINPNVESLFFHGGIAFGEKKYEEAIEYYDEELKMYPVDRNILSMKGWTLVKLGRYEEAMQCFLKCEYNILNIFTRLVTGDDIKKGVEEKRGIMPYITNALKNDDFFMSIKEQIKEDIKPYEEIYILEMEIISLLNVYPSYEELIAHYTREVVAKEMLVKKIH
jgi:tetratricopeptide (TPR) repeat protein